MNRPRLETTADFSAADLSEWTGTLVQQDLIAPGPEVAGNRIREAFDCDLAENGLDCRGILRTRELIASLDPHLACALMIVAPHTHWERGDFILEQFDSERDAYLIGPSQVLPQEIRTPLTPISFVFHPDGPAPFEWADASCALTEENDLDRLWRGVSLLNEAMIAEFGTRPVPLGVSANHRFKSLWGVPSTGTSERPAPEDAHYAIVTRAPTSDAKPEGSVQVGWSAFMAEEYTNREREILSTLEGAMEGMSDIESQKLFEELENYAHTLVKGQ